ncbi:MAG: 8-amino-3,8-dideoxy-manno-octulosonate cytidylyltransferase [Verrucomicrobia subdivision 3 bacterium]|nr:8-amino-3,8-dideoxy-manno-octulosonate cytidylyltransferase [Limisphaerales bacterium]MCS1415839.1 8-amino-3,8-dideoxy-manno-octulosonate cytidylyltransferase [Limisphaerales bacterium]
MNNIAVLPARLASSRFPNKPLAKIHGIPMIGHCYFRTKMAKRLSEVYVATCDQDIYDYIESVGGKAIMTKDSHKRCSDRTAEAVQKIEASSNERVDIVVMVQGDEPMVRPEMIDEAMLPMLENKSIKVVNLMAEMNSRDEHEDPNEVKVVADRNSNALYFSREPIPSRKKTDGDIRMLKQVSIIPFQRDFLFEYLEMEPTPLEIAESVDMNRILEHGFQVKMVLTSYSTYAVDTEEDRKNVEQKMACDLLMQGYMKTP